MGRDDRDWFRERKINYERGGLTNRKNKHYMNNNKGNDTNNDHNYLKTWIFAIVSIFVFSFIVFYMTVPMTANNVTQRENEEDKYMEKLIEMNKNAESKRQEALDINQKENKDIITRPGKITDKNNVTDNNTYIITNEDLEKYKHSTDNSLPQKQYASEQPYTEDTHQKQNHENYQSWCDAGTKCNKKITRANEDVKEAEERYKTARHEYEIYKMYNGRLGNPLDYVNAETNFNNAKTRLKQAKQDLSDLEEQARKKRYKVWLVKMPGIT